MLATELEPAVPYPISVL